MFRFLASFALAAALAAGAWAQSGPFEEARSVIGRTQDDLKRAAESREGHKQSERYANVQKSLSDFDRELAKGKFDKDKLDDAIKDLQNVLDHNTLEPQDRDALRADVKELRVIRAKRGNL